MALPAILWGLGALFAAAIVTTIVMGYINRRALEEKLREEQENAIKAKINEIRELGDYVELSLDLYDDDGNKTEVKVKGEEIDYNELIEGMTLFL